MSIDYIIFVCVLISVCWCDMDSMGYVNNVKYIFYLEEVCVCWMLGVDGVLMIDCIVFVVVVINVNYCLLIVWFNDIVVELFVEWLGNSSIIIGYCIVDQQDDICLYLDGNVVVVWMDIQIGKSVFLLDVICNVLQCWVLFGCG